MISNPRCFRSHLEQHVKCFGMILNDKYRQSVSFSTKNTVNTLLFVIKVY